MGMAEIYAVIFVTIPPHWRITHCITNLLLPEPTNPRNVIFVGQKAPAAGGKTSPSLIYVIESWERQFCPKKKLLQQPGKLSKSDLWHKLSGACFWGPPLQTCLGSPCLGNLLLMLGSVQIHQKTKRVLMLLLLGSHLRTTK